jgi:hypothetical protein
MVTFTIMSIKISYWLIGSSLEYRLLICEKYKEPDLTVVPEIIFSEAVNRPGLPEPRPGDQGSIILQRGDSLADIMASD